MKKVLGLFVLATLLLTVGFASANYVTAGPTKCQGADLCTWTTSGDPDNGLPLGSPDNAGCGLTYNTFWPVGSNENPTYATATCVFDGSNLENVMMYISVDNDIVKCTLNDVVVFEATTHENCAPADPMNGYSKSLTVASGSNTLVCEVRDRGVMSHFDACVVGSQTPIVPEFGSIVAVLTVLGALGTFFVVRRK